MTSDRDRCYVWVWLPEASDPVVAGVLQVVRGDRLAFRYARSYLARDDRVALYLPELPLQDITHVPDPPHDVAGCIRDAAPDSWGQRVIMQRLGLDLGRDPGDVPMLDYLLESGSDRIGALDFQETPDDYVPRHTSAPLEDLLEAATAVDEGRELPQDLADALLRGTAVGGARPKATLVDGERHLIAKFSSSTDVLPVVRYEALAMDLARRAGLDVASTELRSVLGRDVLLVERFDRPGRGRRHMMVSALTIFGLHEWAAHHGAYWRLADLIRSRFSRPVQTLRELFGRLVFNLLVSNTDDHARNHAAFWSGELLTLTPAYDIAPQVRTGNEATQAMAFGRPPDPHGGARGERLSQVTRAMVAAGAYSLDRREARDIIDHQIDVIRTGWDDACDAARLSSAERRLAWERQFLNPYTMEGWHQE